MYYLQGDIITGGTIYKDMFVEIRDKKITFVGRAPRSYNIPVYKVKGFICPGFIDIHIHGVDGYDFMDKDAFPFISKLLPMYGVTSFVATSRTAPLSDITSFLEEASLHQQYGSKLLGVHLEGPWINLKYTGAQRQSDIRKFTYEDMEEIIKPYRNLIKKITLAPEELPEFSMIRDLKALGIKMSAGHTNASFDEIREAIKYGLNQVTHTFNAMSPFHHRSPGTAAAALYFEELICELITDGIHVHPAMAELLYRLKGKERLAIVSDCTGYNKLPDGEYKLRGKQLTRRGNKVTLKDGILAGSAITLDKGVKYAVENCRIPLEDAVFMATETPLISLGSDEKVGKVQAGYYADIVILDEELIVEETIINGESLFRKGSDKFGNQTC